MAIRWHSMSGMPYQCVKRHRDILLIDCDDDIGIQVARCLGRTSSVRVHALATGPRPPIRFSRYVHRHHRQRNATGSAVWEAEVEALLRSGNFDLVFPVRAAGARLLATRGAEWTRLAALHPVPPLEMLAVAEDKWRFAQCCEHFGVPTPPTRRLTELAADPTALRDFPFPVLIKPTDGGQGRGIQRFERPEELQAYLSRPSPPGRPFIVQSLVGDFDIDCSVLCEHGRVITHTIQKSVVESPRPYQPAYVVEFVRHDEVNRIVERLMAGMNWSGVAHLDLRGDSRTGQLHMIELNPRYWGSLLGSLAMGLNFPELAACLVWGEPLPPVESRLGLYGSAREALHDRMRGSQRLGLRFRQTPLRYELADPGPLLAKGLSRCRAGRRS